MNAEKILIFAILAALATAYVLWLTHTPSGRALNTAPEIQPFLTAFGLLPLVVAVGIAHGDAVAVDVALMLAALGLPFLVRGLLRLTKNYVAERSVQDKAAAHAKARFAGRD